MTLPSLKDVRKFLTVNLARRKAWLIAFLIIFAVLPVGYMTAFLLLAEDQTPTPDPQITDGQEIVDLKQGSALALLLAVELSRESVTSKDRRSDLVSVTRYTDQTPYVISSTTLAVRLTQARRLSLAGDVNGDAPWSIGDSLLIESFVDDEHYASVIVGGYLNLIDDKGAAISRLGLANVGYSPKDVAITNVVPIDKIVVLRVSALYGYGASRSGHSDLYLIVE